MEEECKKVRYTTEKFALEDIKRIRKKSDRDTIPCRAYFCVMCNFWHLTSKESRSDILKDKMIAKLQEEVADLKEKLNAKTDEYNKLKKSTGKEDRVAVKSDERVKSLTEKSNNLGKLVQKLRNDNSELITKNLQLERKLENVVFNNNNVK